MEPSAVSSCARINGVHSTSHSERRKDVLLRIDPHVAYASANRAAFEELPENFLETVSPQQSNQSASEFSLTELHREPAADLSADSRYEVRHVHEEPRFLNGSGLISPVPREGQNGPARSLDMCRSLQYIKEESPPPGIAYGSAECEPVYLTSYDPSGLDVLDSGAQSPGSPLSSEMANSVMGNIADEVRYRTESEQKPTPEEEQTTAGKRIRTKTRPRTPPVEPPKRVKVVTYTTSDASDPLNAEIDDDIYIDTRDLCRRVAYELKQHSIPQAIFAERILCRSQGTLSDLLRNPKPWNKLKSGRETFRRMYNWIQQPLSARLAILDMCKASSSPSCSTTPSRARSRPASSSEENAKRPRLVFTDIQKRTLQAIFKETQRPSREMQQTIADHLKLDMSTVSNFFMNARRRSRNGHNAGDEPAPYQQIKPISPPPEGESSLKTPNLKMAELIEHIDEAVSSVASGSSSLTVSKPRSKALKKEAKIKTEEIKTEPGL